MPGAVIGDVAGSVYKRNNVKPTAFGPLLHEKAFYTDDKLCTQLTDG